MTVGLLASIAGLAVLDMLSPATIAVTTVVLLSGGPRSGRLLLTYWSTVAVAYFALGVVLMLGLGAVLSAVDETAVLWVQTAFGAVLLVGRFFIPSGEGGAAKARATPRKP